LFPLNSLRFVWTGVWSFQLANTTRNTPPFAGAQIQCSIQIKACATPETWFTMMLDEARTSPERSRQDGRRTHEQRSPNCTHRLQGRSPEGGREVEAGTGEEEAGEESLLNRRPVTPSAYPRRHELSTILLPKKGRRRSWPVRHNSTLFRQFSARAPNLQNKPNSHLTPAPSAP